LPYAIAFAALPSSIAISKEITPPLWMLLGGALFGMAAHFVNVIKDMEQDHLSGIQGLPQRLGTKSSVFVAMTLVTAGVFAIYFTA
jgi:4-hydroxybenzoate polyprenyltransferase